MPCSNDPNDFFKVNVKFSVRRTSFTEKRSSYVVVYADASRVVAVLCCSTERVSFSRAYLATVDPRPA